MLIEIALIVLGTIVAVAGVIAISALAALWRTWWLYPIYQWYLVPLRVPMISFWHFMALMLVIGYLTGHVDLRKDERPIDWAAVAAAWISPVVLWVVTRYLL